MAKYTWGYSDEVFTSLADVKKAIEEMVDDFLRRNHLELIYSRRRAVREVKPAIRLVKH